MKIDLYKIVTAVAIAFAVIFCGTQKQADAVPITSFGFTGNVTSVNLALSGTFDTNQTLSGSYTFESTTADTEPGNLNWAQYDGALTSFSLTIGSYTATGLSYSANKIGVIDDYWISLPAFDNYQVTQSSLTGPGLPDPSSIFTLDPFQFFLRLRDLTGTAFSSDAMPLTLDLSDFSEIPSYWSLDFRDFRNIGGYSVSGEITSLTMPASNPIPEPATLFLLGSGLFGLGAIRRKFKN